MKILEIISKELLATILNDRFSNVSITTESGVYKKHGKLVKLITNTHSPFRIAKFEVGNEFITESALEIIVNKYLNKNG